MTADNMTDEEWHAWRRAGITATDVADAANDTYGGAYAVVANKLELVPATEETAQMTRGHRWQEAIADAVHALTGWHVLGEEACAEHELDDRWRATVDGFLAEFHEATRDEVIGVLEVKTRGVDVRPNRARWRDQVQWQLLVTEARAGIIAEAVIDDSTDRCTALFLTIVEADPYRQAELLELAEQLWSAFVAGELPAPTASSLPLVKQLSGAGVVGLELDLDDLADEVHRLADMRAALEAAEAEADRLEAVLRAAMGTATVARAGGALVKLSPGQRKIPAATSAELVAEFPEYTKRVLDLDRFKVGQPAVYEAARRPAGGRRLTILTDHKGDSTDG